MTDISTVTPLTTLVGNELIPVLGAPDGGGSSFRSATPEEIAYYTGIRQLAGGTLSAAATLDIPIGLYWPDYSELEIHLLNFIPGTDGAELLCRVSTDGGVSFNAGSTDYKYAHTRQVSDAITPQGARSAGTTAISLNNGNGAGSGTSEGMSARVSISGWGNTALKPRIRYDCDVYTDNDLIARFMGAGLRNTAQAVTDLRFLFASGNIASGKYRVIGIV